MEVEGCGLTEKPILFCSAKSRGKHFCASNTIILKLQLISVLLLGIVYGKTLISCSLISSKASPFVKTANNIASPACHCLKGELNWSHCHHSSGAV